MSCSLDSNISHIKKHELLRLKRTVHKYTFMALHRDILHMHIITRINNRM